MTGIIIFWQPDSKILFWQDSFSKTNTAHSDVQEATSGKSTITADKSTHQATAEKTDNGLYDDNRDDIIEDFIPNPEAVAAMRQARLEGDPRAPKLGTHHEREIPTEEELGDHEQYLEYERRQQKRIYRAYVDASKIKTAQLRSMIEQGKTEGVSAAEIAFAEEKIRGIEEMAIKLQQDHPDIMDSSYQPPADWLIENLGKDDNSNKSDETKVDIAQ
jgi:hypothetical protein